MKKSDPRADAYKYHGCELEMMGQANNWKSYLADQVKPFIRGNVLEVGSGMCAKTLNLYGPLCSTWVCLEPDPDLARRGQESLHGSCIESLAEIRVGTTECISSNELFDSIIYIDVLEHIQDDEGELQRAAGLLRPEGRIIIVAPAHPFLFSPFDSAVGHYRRYDGKSLRNIMPERLIEERVAYLDSFGMLASLANRLLMRRSMATAVQLKLWDTLLVRLSRFADSLVAYTCGKTVLAVWRRPSDDPIRYESAGEGT